MKVGCFVVMNLFCLYLIKKMNNREGFVIILIGKVLFFSDDTINVMDHFRKSSFLIKFFGKIKDMMPKALIVEPWLVGYDNFQFFKLFRMEKKTFSELVNVIGKTDGKKLLDKPYTGGHHPINIYGHILIFLWYMATQDTLLSIGTRFKVSPTTVMNVTNRVLYFMLKLKATYIRFPKNESEMRDISERFKKYPGVIGAVDGTHIFVKVEKTQQDSYIDRYRRTSINLMAICDSNTLFTYIFVGYPGSAHDSRVFENSLMCKNIERYGPNFYFLDYQKYHLIGDSAFALKTWLVTPYRGDNLTRKQKYHNYCLSSERVKIEHSFGGYKGRWRRVQYINTYNICKAIEIATAACVLHNFCILHKDTWEEYFLESDINRTVDAEREVRGNIEAKLKRDRIADNLFLN